MLDTKNGRKYWTIDTLKNEISFVHSSLPARSLSPNILVADGCEEYPGIQGTGFFCNKNGSIFYVTARHCLTKDHKQNIAEFSSLLRIPYTETTEFNRKTVAFDSVFSVTHKSEDIPGTFLDAVAFRVSESTAPDLMAVLLERSIRLPPSGEWFNNFINSKIAKTAFDDGDKISLTGMGFPLAEPYSRVVYPADESQLTEINVNAISFKGEIGKGVYADRVKLNGITWPGDMDGMSGSPMFVHFTENGQDAFALAGMLITAGGGTGQLMRIDVLSSAIHKPHLPSTWRAGYRGISGEQFHGSSAS